MNASKKPRLPRLRNALRAAAPGLLILAVLGALVAVAPGHGLTGSLSRIEHIIRSWGPWAALAAILLMVVHSFVPLPAEAITVANGMVFGPVWGTVVTWVGAMLGAWVAFGLARLFGRPLVVRFLPERRRRRLDEWAMKKGAASLLVLRLIPFVAFNLVNYAAGLAHVSWWTFTWTTALGILPLGVLLVVLGDRVANLPDVAALVLLAVALVGWWVARIIRKRYRLRHKQ